jgi:GNAT superfamily N-acetyltransferase
MSSSRDAIDPAVSHARAGVVTRYATAGDASALLQLMMRLASFEGYAAQFTVTERDLVERGLGRASAAQFTAIVAEDSPGQLRGYAVVQELAFTYDLRPTLILKELFVDDSHRGGGVGSAIMAAVLAHARGAGCGRLRWDVLPGNERARAFYRRLGGGPNSAWESWILRLDERGR